ncbi:MAG: HAD hydrolase family protein [Nanoarchaeota archaeon]|nr:HAD hydrolase family protein [Nanoarchaeota archaeon]
MKIQKIKLVTLDVDGSLVNYTNVGSRFHSSWDALGFAYGLKDMWDERTNQFYGTGDDKKWAELDALDLKGREVKKCFKVLYPLPYTEGALDFAKKSKGRLIRGILSTCIDLVGIKAKEELDLDFAYCNFLKRNNGYFSGEVDYLVPIGRKSERIEEICRRFNVKPNEICHIGDNDNDIPVGKEVGLFLAINPKTELIVKEVGGIIKNFYELSEVFNLK